MSQDTKNLIMDTDELISELAHRTGATKTDIRFILRELRAILEECLRREVSVSLRGLFQLKIFKMKYKKAPGIVAYHGNKTFNKEVRRARFIVPENFSRILREGSE